MVREEFSIGDSVLHHLDPRVKVPAAAAFSTVVALSTRWSAMEVALGAALTLVAFARLPLGALFRRLFVVNGFIALFWAVLPVSISGTPWMHVGPLSLSVEGMALAGRMTLKSNGIILAFIALVATSSVGRLGAAMNRLKMPEKLTHLLLLTYRYLFVIQEEYERLKRAAVVRGFRPKTNLHTYRTYAYMVAILFVRAAARAERVQHAMVCRGFAGRFHALEEAPLTGKDWIGALALGGMVMGVAFMEWGAWVCS